MLCTPQPTVAAHTYAGQTHCKRLFFHRLKHIFLESLRMVALQLVQDYLHHALPRGCVLHIVKPCCISKINAGVKRVVAESFWGFLRHRVVFDIATNALHVSKRRQRVVAFLHEVTQPEHCFVDIEVRVTQVVFGGRGRAKVNIGIEKVECLCQQVYH